MLNPILATVMYETVPEHLGSRVVGATTSAALVVTPLGGLAAGFLVDAVGLPAALLAPGGVYLVVTLGPVVFPVWRRIDAPGAGLSERSGR